MPDERKSETPRISDNNNNRNAAVAATADAASEEEEYSSTPRRRGGPTVLPDAAADAAVPPGAASGLMNMFAPPPPLSGPAAAPTTAAAAARAEGAGAASGLINMFAPPLPVAGAGAASGLLDMFAPPPPSQAANSNVGVNEEAAVAAAAQQRLPVQPLLPPPGVIPKLKLERQGTEVRSNRSTSSGGCSDTMAATAEAAAAAAAADFAASTLVTPNIRNARRRPPPRDQRREERSSSSSSGVGLGGAGGAEAAAHVRFRSDAYGGGGAASSASASTPTQPMQPMQPRTPKTAGSADSSGGGESPHSCNERKALLAAHALTERDRYLVPSTDLHTLHDMFRPPPSPGGRSATVDPPSAGVDDGGGGQWNSAPHSYGGYSSIGNNSTDRVDAERRTLPGKELAVSVGGGNRGAYHGAGAAAVRADASTSSSSSRIQSCYHRILTSGIACKMAIGQHLPTSTSSSTSSSWTAEHVSSTLVGSFTFVLFHIVFCLAESSAISEGRVQSTSTSVLGAVMKIAALGAIVQGPVLVYFLGGDLPALYPSVDLFLAPFLAQMATRVDASLAEQGVADDDAATFLATFMILNGIGLLVTAFLNLASYKCKLANLGGYLPYSVICGFFTYVGLTLWMLAFTVDTGERWNTVLLSGDWDLIQNALVHHLPSLLVGILLCVLGPKNPALTPLIVVFTVLAGYFALLVTGTSLEEAQHQGWFYTKEDFYYEKQSAAVVGFVSWAPPTPFGMIPSLFLGTVNGGAVLAGLPSAFAMSAIYLLRCSLHAAALKKSCANLSRMKLHQPPTVSKPSSTRKRLVSEDLDADSGGDGRAEEEKPPVSMVKILLWYGNSLALGAFVGGFGVLPGVAVGATLCKLGSSGVAPQYGSIVLLFCFYVTDFALVRYIPKPAFSCLLILASLDMVITWFFHSFTKTKNKGEWAVVPAIVVSSFVIGQLMSVALGIALSTFIFVAHLHRAGVVKFLANGLTIRSTIERSALDADLLDQKGDLIQCLVLQNYLFFGNANSCLDYISTMFEESPASSDALGFELPPIPKYLTLDLTLVTGMDTSAVDVFADIVSLCKSNLCEVIIAGCSSDLKSTFAHGNVKPTRGLRFLPDMESALGKAEDGVLKKVLKMEEKYSQEAGTRTRDRLKSEDDDGFRFALRQIDEQHGISFASDLVALQRFTSPLELEPGQSLFDSDGGFDGEADRGLFFIEHGLMKVERDPNYTMTRGSNASLRRKVGPGFASQQRAVAGGGSISQLNARTATIGREAALLKATATYRDRTSHTFRLARIGPGWVVGAIEGCSGLRNPGIHVAITSCRLHHLPFSSLQELEKSKPSIVLRLFKMMSHLMSRRQEMTIEQLATLRLIMTSSASTKPVSRVTMGAIQNALSYQ